MPRFAASVFLSMLLVGGSSAAQSFIGQEPPPPLYRCADEFWRNESKEATYSGFYEGEFEGSSFKISKVPCEVWLTGDICSIFPKRRCSKGAQVKAYVTVSGVLSKPGNFGHGGMWERELRVTRVIKVQRIN